MTEGGRSTVTVSFTVGTDDGPFGPVFKEIPAARIEFERDVLCGETLLPYVWVHDVSADVLRGALERDEGVRGVTVLDSLSDRTLVHVEWKPEITRLGRAIGDNDGAILEATGDSER